MVIQTKHEPNEKEKNKKVYNLKTLKQTTRDNI